MSIRFTPPQSRTVTLTRPIWVKGKGLPKDGAQLFREGETVNVYTDNGADWYLKATYRGKTIKVATILSSL